MTAEHSNTSMPGHQKENPVNLADAQVFGAIWKANKESLYWLAYKVLDNQQEAQDVVTESFVKLYHSTNIFNNEAAVRGWLRVTVRNSALKLLEKMHSAGTA
jgi:RNA polymerase sigma-70 factor, ECF subfamily